MIFILRGGHLTPPCKKLAVNGYAGTMLSQGSLIFASSKADCENITLTYVKGIGLMVYFVLSKFVVLCVYFQDYYVTKNIYQQRKIITILQICLIQNLSM